MSSEPILLHLHLGMLLVVHASYHQELQEALVDSVHRRRQADSLLPHHGMKRHRYVILSRSKSIDCRSLNCGVSRNCVI
jgi:hypothetical protein